MVSDLSRVFYE